MKSQISLAFQKCKKENRPALLTYTVAGDNTKKKSLEILKSISEHVDILEIGMPFNAPTADGSQIQNSSYRAIKNGIKLKDIFQIVKKNFSYTALFGTPLELTIGAFAKAIKIYSSLAPLRPIELYLNFTPVAVKSI